MAEALKDAQIADPGKVAASDSLLPIMHGQRERYRQRAQELETVRYVIVLYGLSCSFADVLYSVDHFSCKPKLVLILYWTGLNSHPVLYIGSADKFPKVRFL